MMDTPTFLLRATRRGIPFGKASVKNAPAAETESETMPAGLTTLIFTSASLGSTSLMAAATYSSVPGAQDGWSAVGAALATVITAVTARKTDKTLPHSITVIISSFFCGTLIPSAFMWWKFPGEAPMVIWSVWCLTGFFVGLAGWGIVNAFMKYVPGMVVGWLKKKFLAGYTDTPPKT